MPGKRYLCNLFTTKFLWLAKFVLWQFHTFCLLSHPAVRLLPPGPFTMLMSFCLVLCWTQPGLPVQSWVWNYTLEPSGLTDGAATKENDFFPQSISIKLISRERGRTSWAPGWPMAVDRPCLAQVTMQVTTATMSSCLWWLCCALKTTLGSHSLHLRVLTPFLLPFPWYSLDLRRDGGIHDLFRANLSTVTRAEHTEPSWIFCIQCHSLQREASLRLRVAFVYGYKYQLLESSLSPCQFN